LWLPNSVDIDANTIQMPTQRVRLWADNACIGVSSSVAEALWIWQEKCGWTTQQKENDVREGIWVIAQSMMISNKHGTRPEKWDLLIDRCITPISNLVSQRPLWKWNIADHTILDGKNLKAALDKFAEVGLRWRKNWIDETLTQMRKYIHVGMYFIAQMVVLPFLMIWRYTREWGRKLGSQGFTNNGPWQCLNRFTCRVI